MLRIVTCNDKQFVPALTSDNVHAENSEVLK